MKLSKRLQTIADFVKKDAVVADIGTDHAHIPIYLIENNIIDKAYACDINKGPLEKAKENIANFGVSKNIVLRLSNGLDKMSNKEVDTIIIAGMGGELISRILEAGYSGSHLNGRERLILQPNVAEHFVREWLMKHSYRITYETVVEDNHRLYEIIVAEPVGERVEYTELELKYGPVLLQQPSELSVAKWNRMNRKNKEILEQLQKSKAPQLEKIEQFEKAFNELQGVIDRANS